MNQPGVMLEDVLKHEFVVDELLQIALDPTHQDIDPDEYVTQEPESAITNTESLFKPLDQLVSENDRTFGSLIQEAEEKVDLYRVADASAADSESIFADPVQPASPLSELLTNGPLVNNGPVTTDPNSFIPPTSPETSDVKVIIDKDSVNVSMKEIRIALGSRLPFSIQQKTKSNSELGFFVRDASIVRWNEEDKALYAQKEGSTELYLHYENQLLILPIHVGHADQQLQIPKELTLLNNLGQPKKLLASLDNNLTRENAIVNTDLSNKPHASKRELAENNEADILDKVSSSRTEEFSFQASPATFETEKMQIRIVDERTDEKGNKIYPIPGIDVHLIGSELFKKTDSLGLVSGIDVPKNSSFIVTVKDPFQRYRPSVVEIPASKIKNGKSVTIRLMQQSTYEAYSQITASEYHKDAGSICATVQTADGKPLSAATLALDWPKARPYYFNRYGYLDPQADRTSESGRFCVFNLEPGPFAFYFRRATGEQETPIPLTLFAGSHVEHVFVLGEKTEITTALAAAPTAFEMWHGGRIMEKDFRAIDYASLVSLGSKYDWDYDSEAETMHSDQNSNDGRTYYLAHSSEFEETLYRVDTNDDSHSSELVTPVFPNGFLEDISYYSNILRVPNTGTVMIEHGSFEGQFDLAKTVVVTLLDQNSKQVGEKVSMNTNSTSSTIFFNVAPGAYTVLVKTADGIGLSYDTALVYSDTMSYLRTGSPLYRINKDSPSQVAQY